MESHFKSQRPARFVKIIVEGWHEHISMRATVLVPDPSLNAARAATLFKELLSVNDELKTIACKLAGGKLKLEKSNLVDTCEGSGDNEGFKGCYLGVYRRAGDKNTEARLLLEKLIAAGKIPASARTSLDDDS